MDMFYVLLIVLAVIAAVFLALKVLLPYLKNKGVDVSGILDQTQQAFGAINSTLDTLKPFLPNTPGLAAFEKILAAAEVGVGKAEQLYYVGELEGGQRKEAAEQYILDALQLIGVEVTPEVQNLIDGAIEHQVLSLGHTATEAASE
ncbi:hypothetical protein LJC32_05265 [Oscillospiraceae bacterium OttesenSCG-928-F05]|nr:hypothetical protein [Oscillospiraceae bacterium OttesenSCG-928-F05]